MPYHGDGWRVLWDTPHPGSAWASSSSRSEMPAVATQEDVSDQAPVPSGGCWWMARCVPRAPHHSPRGVFSSRTTPSTARASPQSVCETNLGVARAPCLR